MVGEECVSHDLSDFMASVTREMEDEYYRIQKRAREDPGMAGDQGEENWAELLGNWLPQGYHVRTKGRILSDKNIASKQMDVVVLKPSYPRHLLGKKMYLAAGVAAAFECKLSLKATHIKGAFNSLRGVFKPRAGSIYEELHIPIVHGILAHSHSWKSRQSKPVENITHTLSEYQNNLTLHPREKIDIVCVADLGTWSAMRNSTWGSGWRCSEFGMEGFTSVNYMCASKANPNQIPSFTPIGTMLAFLWRRIGFEDASIQPLAKYFWYTTGPGEGAAASGPSSPSRRNAFVFSEKTLDQMRRERFDEDWWAYWRHTFY